MATLMEKDTLIHLIAYAMSIIVLKQERSDEYEKNADFLVSKRDYIYSTSPQDIDFDVEVAAIKPIIEKYKHLPNLPEFQ
ncbi:MAG: hypothetical protein Q4G42_05500 [Neisseria sp.]|nr:hypothetical protein [Neisseria sp.]